MKLKLVPTPPSTAEALAMHRRLLKPSRQKKFEPGGVFNASDETAKRLIALGVAVPAVPAENIEA